MAALVTLAQVKAHLRIDTVDGDPADADLVLKLNQASDMVRDYLKTRAVAAWDADDTVPGAIAVPGPVQAGVLLTVGHLYEHRGDDLAGTVRALDVALWGALELLLVRFRDPAFA